jgi:hypothetical protein
MISYRLSVRFALKIMRLSILILIFIFINSCKKEEDVDEPGCLLKRCELIRNWNSGFQIDTVNMELEYELNGLMSKFVTHEIDDGYEYVTNFYFFYNDNDRIMRIDEYDGYDLELSYVFTWNNNTAKMEQWWDEDDSLELSDRIFEWEFNSHNELIRLNDYMDLNSDDVSELWEYWIYYYQNGSLVKMEDYSPDNLLRTLIYTNDDKHNPLSETHLGWFFDFDLFISKNNFLTEEIYHPEQNQPSTTKSYSYKYNEHEYPVMMNTSQISPSFTLDEVWKFEYDCDSI